MSNLLQLQGGEKAFGAKMIFNDAQFAVNEGEHVGVIGPNGAGKTTLFRILAEQDTLDGGVITRAKGLRLGYLAQHDNWNPQTTVEEFLEQGTIKPIWELKSLGHDLGIPDGAYDRPIQSLSGGYRMRCKLLSLIGHEPDLMLLDEPTNYLDLETTLVLEKFLQGYKGAFLLISHDREFLRRTTDHILEIEQGSITKYNGNLDDYFEQKNLLRSQLEARAMSQQEKKDKILEFVARFGAKATKARQAQSRLKSLDKMEAIELKPLPVTAAVKIPSPVKTGKVILTLEKADLGYGERIVLRNVNFLLKNGEHVAVVGLNGAGKSTFLKVLAQALAPLRGTVQTGLNVSIGYYAQHVAESLDANSTVIDQMMAKAQKDLTLQDGLNMAGSLLFSGEDVRKKISVLSGGEKSRVALGQILLQRAPCLILDEPTNHLDFQTVEALTQALVDYPGTVVTVSHDRGFIGRVGTQIVEINNGQASHYPGTYEDYVWSLQKGVLSQRDGASPILQSAEPQGNAAPSTSTRANYKEAKKSLDRQLKQCERTLGELDKKLAELNKKLSSLNEAVAAGAYGAAESIRELGLVQNQIDQSEGHWLETVDLKEKLEKELALLTGQ
jgi:ATP-binding cassette, subfamily F, member 3